MRKSLRIAVYHDLPSGGAKRALHQQVARLRARGHRVHAFIPATADETFLPLAEVASDVTVVPRPAPPDRERILRNPSVGDIVRWGRFLVSLWHSERLAAELIDRSGAQVALVAPSQFTQAPLLLRRLRTPALYFCQEPLRAAYEPGITPPFIRFAIRQTLGRIDRSTVRCADAVTVNSAFSAQAITACYGVTPTLSPLGVDTNRFHPIDDAMSDLVLTVGAIHPLKGHDLVIEAVAALPQERRPTVMIIGDRSRTREEMRLRDLAMRLGVTVSIHHRVTDDALVRLYARATMVVLTPHAEPFGLVALEALACARPVIAVDEGGLREIVQPEVTGFLEPRDPIRLARRIDQLLRDPALRQRMGARGRQHVVEAWSWERAIDRLETQLSKLSDLR